MSLLCLHISFGNGLQEGAANASMPQVISKCCCSVTGSEYEPVTISCVQAQLQSWLFCPGYVNGTSASSLVTLFTSPKHKYRIKLAVKMKLNNQLGSVPSLLYHRGGKRVSEGKTQCS